jgi:hypothetical protein
MPSASTNEADTVGRILSDLQRQFDLSLEYRIREVLTPILARAADSLVREARADLTRALHEIVVRAVAQELQRQRSP